MSEPAEVIDEATGEVVTDSQLTVATAREGATMVRAAPGDVAEAFAEYRKIQQQLDEAMPDCLMQIQGKNFRKKNYWRAVATAFNLSVELVSEKQQGSLDDSGWIVIYRAVAPNGRTATGDGACFDSEKWSDRPVCPVCQSSEFAFRSKKDDSPAFFCWRSKGGCGTEWDPDTDAKMDVDKSQATVHNVRGHAHTRAFNRSVSNLVGFGEVSAEEMGRESAPQRAKPMSNRKGRAANADAVDEGAFDQPLGFGMHKDKPWRWLTEGSPGGDRHSYMTYMIGRIEADLAEKGGNPRSEEKLDRFRKCLAVADKRWHDESEPASKGDAPSCPIDGPDGEMCGLEEGHEGGCEDF